MHLANQNIDTSCSKDETFKKQENLMTGKIQFYFFLGCTRCKYLAKC